VLQAIGLILLGLALLFLGAEALVRGSSRFAAALGLSPLFIGLTLVAYGTSSPELLVSTYAAIEDLPDLAIGNVVGSNTFNVGIVLGLSAMVRPIACPGPLVRREMPFAIGVVVLLAAFSLGGLLSRLEAALLLVGVIAYAIWIGRAALQAESRAEVRATAREPNRRGWPAQLLLALVGLGLLVAGARWLVNGVEELARLLDVPERVISLTIVAGGTSLPELATSAVAAYRREPDIAVGNVLGSNIFNVLAILGIAGLIRPLQVNPAMLWVDMPVCVLFGLSCVPFGMRKQISRASGLILVGAYAVYTVALYLWR
jgi:cation:H+ antiporter